jgi:hypothetical protein
MILENHRYSVLISSYLIFACVKCWVLATTMNFFLYNLVLLYMTLNWFFTGVFETSFWTISQPLNICTVIPSRIYKKPKDVDVGHGKRFQVEIMLNELTQHFLAGTGYEIAGTFLCKRAWDVLYKEYTQQEPWNRSFFVSCTLKKVFDENNLAFCHLLYG